MTWLIWGALHRQPDEIHQHLSTVHDSPEAIPPRQLTRSHIALAVLSLLLGLIVVYWIASNQTLTLLVSNGLVLLLGIIGGLILASGTLNGARWAFQVGQIVYRDIHDGRYDLLSLSPLGVLGALWLITHRQTRFNRIVAFFQTVGLAIFIAMVAVGLVFIYAVSQGSPTVFLSQPILGSVLTLALLVLIFYLDYVQSVVIGHLSGIYLASLASSQTLAEFSAMAILIAIQFATYLMAGLLVFLGAVASTYIFRETSEATVLLLAVVFIGSAYSFREFVIRVLWRAILTRFAVTHIEFAKFRQGVP